MSAKTIIESGKAILGIEFGSTRIKAVLIDTDNNPIEVLSIPFVVVCLTLAIRN